MMLVGSERGTGARRNGKTCSGDIYQIYWMSGSNKVVKTNRLGTPEILYIVKREGLCLGN